MAYLALSLTTILLTVLAASSDTVYHDYLVIGAGPGGVQLGYYLQKANRDYLLLEKGGIPGHFFERYPRHDVLISINKRFTGKTNREFNMRHDWNSLLSDDDSLLFKEFSHDFLPHRSTMLTYLRNYTQTVGIKIQFNTKISDVHPVKDNPDFKFSMMDQDGNIYNCKTLVVATGFGKLNDPDFEGFEHTVGYDTVSVNPDDFEGQGVLVLGRGNSAFEVAQQIYGATKFVHMYGRSRLRLSWSTHYVGDLRAVNNALLDTYQLKSQDGIIEGPMEEAKIVKANGKLYLEQGIIINRNESESRYMDNFPMRDAYDTVIRCLGFAFDTDLFSKDTKIHRADARKSKFPLAKQNYESIDVPGMFYAGTITHSLDHRKSSGGFIHGFRYTARALHRLLEWRNHQIQWPSISGPVTEVVSAIMKRINEASGPYQMFHFLGDVVLFKNDFKDYEILEDFPVKLLHEFPEQTGKTDYDAIMVILLQYGADFSGPANDVFSADRATGEPAEAHHSNFLHPVFYYYKKLPTGEQMENLAPKQHLPRPDAMHHCVEDFLTNWNAPTGHTLPIRRFIENVLNKDLRYFFADDCYQKALLFGTTPENCEQHFLSGPTLFEPQSILSQAK